MNIRRNSPGVHFFIPLITVFFIFMTAGPAAICSPGSGTDRDSTDWELKYYNIRLIYPSSGVQHYRNGIIYLIDSKFTETRKYIPFGSLSMYYAPVKGDTLGKPFYFLRNEPFPFPSEGCSFTSDNKKIVFTKYSRIHGWKHSSIKIYEASIKLRGEGKDLITGKMREMPFNSDMYSCIQPAISPDGQFLVFSSDMPGGHGGLDLYISHNVNGTWDSPENLGQTINSPKDDNFPFLDDKNNLFFSSKGHGSVGGYDVYFARSHGNGEWADVESIGPPVNSTGDDIAFYLRRGNNTAGYMATNRNTSDKNYQVFKVSICAAGVSSPDQLFGAGRSRSRTEVTKALVKEQVAVSEEKKPPAVGSSGTTARTVTEKATTAVTPEKKVEPAVQPAADQGAINYRVQFRSSGKSLGSFKTTIEGTDYPSFEYFYKGAYRYTIGNFEKWSAADVLCKKCRAAGYPEAFVVTFKGDERVIK